MASRLPDNPFTDENSQPSLHQLPPDRHKNSVVRMQCLELHVTQFLLNFLSIEILASSFVCFCPWIGVFKLRTCLFSLFSSSFVAICTVRSSLSSS
jgi:hypothetical protein